ncbi:SEC-C domain-containing protein [bacterium]|nr:SEC-C domain-containing protein [bacterium]
MISRTNEEIIELIFKAQISEQPPSERGEPKGMVTRHASATGMGFSSAAQQQASQPPTAKRKPVKVEQRVGRNDPCPCGSGKKYKKCCGRNV